MTAVVLVMITCGSVTGAVLGGWVLLRRHTVTYLSPEARETLARAGLRDAQ